MSRRPASRSASSDAPAREGHRRTGRLVALRDRACRSRRMIPITMPLVGEEEALAAAEVVRSGWLTQGPRVSRFEEDFAAITGASHACAVSNCTTALHLALLARWRRRGRRGDHRQPHLHCLRQRHSPMRRHTGLRRHRGRSATAWMPSLTRRGHHPEDARHPLRSPDRHALRHGCDHGGRPCARAKGGRRRRLRPGI